MDRFRCPACVCWVSSLCLWRGGRTGDTATDTRRSTISRTRRATSPPVPFVPPSLPLFQCSVGGPAPTAGFTEIGIRHANGCAVDEELRFPLWQHVNEYRHTIRRHHGYIKPEQNTQSISLQTSHQNITIHRHHEGTHRTRSNIRKTRCFHKNPPPKRTYSKSYTKTLNTAQNKDT
jgi:hypothetical protein